METPFTQGGLALVEAVTVRLEGIVWALDRFNNNDVADGRIDT